MGRLNWDWVPKYLCGKIIKSIEHASNNGAIIIFETGEKFKLTCDSNGIICTPLDKHGKVIQQYPLYH